MIGPFLPSEPTTSRTITFCGRMLIRLNLTLRPNLSTGRSERLLRASPRSSEPLLLVSWIWFASPFWETPHVLETCLSIMSDSAAARRHPVTKWCFACLFMAEREWTVMWSHPLCCRVREGPACGYSSPATNHSALSGTCRKRARTYCAPCTIQICRAICDWICASYIGFCADLIDPFV